MDKILSKDGIMEVPSEVELMSEDKGLFGSAGDAQIWDFSKANSSKESRIAAVQKVASVCFQSNVKVGTSALYDKLMSESLGLPSSSFEFVPVLLRIDDIEFINREYLSNILHFSDKFTQVPRVEKYGVTIIRDKEVYKLTNLRALLYDIELINTTKNEKYKIDASSRFFNSDKEEIAIIHENFFVFNTKIDIVTARQFMRHRTSWQELSRRYVSGKKVPFEVYLTNNMSEISVDIYDTLGWSEPLSQDKYMPTEVNAIELIMMCLKMYDTALESGIKPQDARRIIPQGALTQVWSAWLKPQFDEMIELRSAAKAQWEIRTLAKSLSGLVSRTR